MEVDELQTLRETLCRAETSEWVQVKSLKVRMTKKLGFKEQKADRL